MPYLSRRALTGLAKYEYVSSGLTWLDDLHKPAWEGERDGFFGAAAASHKVGWHAVQLGGPPLPPTPPHPHSHAVRRVSDPSRAVWDVWALFHGAHKSSKTNASASETQLPSHSARPSALSLSLNHSLSLSPPIAARPLTLSLSPLFNTKKPWSRACPPGWRPT